MRLLDLSSIQNSSSARVFAFGCALLMNGCCSTGSSGDATTRTDAAPNPSSTSAPATSSSVTTQLGPRVENAEPDGVPIQPAPVEREIAGAMHILIAYKGAENAPKTITRTKDDAHKRADDVLQQLKKDEGKFAELVKKYSDDATSKPADGRLGNFERNAMPVAFSDACFAMKVDALSDVVESPRGFHIIKRTK